MSVHDVWVVLSSALMITGFVFVMMVVIEYVNVLTRGRWQGALARWTWGQSVLSAGLGVTPGCLGAFAVTSLYMHRIVTVGAAVACMIATSGDEAFVMLAMFPRRALLLFCVLFALGSITGVVTDLFLKGRRTSPSAVLESYRPSHPEEETCIPFSLAVVARQWRECSPHRGLLTLILAAFLVGVLSGALGHRHPGVEFHSPDQETHLGHAEPGHHAVAEAPHEQEHGGWNWVRVTILALTLIGFGIVFTVPDHFLDEHLWNHIARVHVWRIFLWTFGALLLVQVVSLWIDVHAILGAHRLPVLLTACLLGLIPESGPHLVFVTLYAGGAVPFSTLLASSIVQDGHGMIPMLAHSRRAFLFIKAVNLGVGLAAGLLGLVLGF